MKPFLCSQADAGMMLDLGKTKVSGLIAEGQLETVRIGSRRLVKIASVERLAGVENNQKGEA